MNTSHYSQNMNEVQSPNAKTGENLNRLGKISEKLKNIHSNITSEKYSRYAEVEARLSALTDKSEESQNEILKNFESTKKEIAELIQMIENDRISFDESYEARTQYISKLEFKLMEQFNNERDERNAMCNRLISNVDNKYMILKNELAKEEKNRDESIDNFKNYLESEVPKLVSQMKNEQEVREDGKLYKNGIIYSRKVIRKVRGMVARLKSGHCVCPTSENELNTIKKFLITRPTGEIEFEIEIPWAFDRNEQKGCFYDWSFGNYGEMYALCAPLAQSLDQPYNGNFTKGNAELIVVRNYLKYFGILNDDRIRLRKGPGTDTESLGTYPVKTGFRILEDSGVNQTIDGVNSEWIKVRLLDGTEGYFFGQYVQNLYDGPGTPLPWPNVPDWD